MRTVEKVILPVDVEYTMHFKIKERLIHLNNNVGMKMYSNEKVF
ncbi:hypothetical protein RV02_GL001583 [Enterococcus gilvus]|uniref:Uncharacterized protein n=1 Tax=Enterococcus gilvus ATCC BAA-350 TaxID=1158614 RepID=R2Y610_9ENTE|nr:hypothetical protein UKC_00807 [Enterococcus gilvus ATCC BAA-350]EOW79414.1 hypothetical protein I592_03554 [Enterococcus gilvus ATCC BAA-350]OJG44185.1 hypothetical protein RV02_GL001583 [Enterococcus gilvus]